MGIICDTCGRDIDALGQDNMSCTCEPLCEDCWNEQQSHAVAVLRQENDRLRGDRLPGMAQGRVRRRHRRAGGAMNRPGCNWGCLLFIAAAIAIDAAAIYAIRALVLGLMAMAVAAC